MCYVNMKITYYLKNVEEKLDMPVSWCRAVFPEL